MSSGQSYSSRTVSELRGSSAFAVHIGGTSRGRGGRGGQYYRDPIICDECKKPGHTVDTCYQLHPELRPLRTAVQGEHVAHMGSGMMTVTRAEYEEFIRWRASATPVVTTLAQSQIPTSLVSTATRPWVIDSGATHHMTGDRHQLHDTTVTGSSSSVTLADGSHSQITGTGSTDWPTHRWWA